MSEVLPLKYEPFWATETDGTEFTRDVEMVWGPRGPEYTGRTRERKPGDPVLRIPPEV